MNRQWKVLWIASILAIVSLPSPAQEKVPLERVVQYYLLQDCGTGERNPRAWLNQILAQKQSATPLLMTALKEGLPADQQRALRQTAQEDFKSLKRHLEQGGLADIENKDVLRAAQQLDEQSYVNRRVRDATSAYQSRALSALMAMNDPQIRQSLGRMASAPELAPEVRKMIEQTLPQRR